jgi:hypothetical protein
VITRDEDGPALWACLNADLSIKRAVVRGASYGLTKALRALLGVAAAMPDDAACIGAAQHIDTLARALPTAVGSNDGRRATR